MWLYWVLTIYILLCAFIIFSLRRTRKEKILYLLLTMGLLAFLTMFKSEQIGNDTDSYINIFKSISSGTNISKFKDRYEIGFLYLNIVLSIISKNHQILFIVTGIYIYFAYGRLIYKYSQIVWLSVFLFFTLGSFDLSMSGIRQMMALATVVLSYEYIIKEKLFKFVFTVLIATLFHNAAIVFFIAYPLSKFKLTKKLVLGVIGGSIVAYIGFMPLLKIVILFFPKYSYYLNGTYLDGQARISTVFSIIVISLILFVSEICNRRFGYKYKENNQPKGFTVISDKTREDEIQSTFLLIGCAFLFVSLKGTILSRFENIYSLFLIIYYPNAIAKIKNTKIKVVILQLTILLFIAYSVVIQIYRPEWQSTYPYTFFWN